MKVEISVPEIVSVFKEIQQQPERIYELIRTEVRENVGLGKWGHILICELFFLFTSLQRR